MIREFNPDYLAYGIEVNMLAASNPEAFNKYRSLTEKVYRILKKENPNLPIFLTFYIRHFHQFNQTEPVRQLLPFTDYMAVSCYPFLEGYNSPKMLPPDWFSRLAQFAPEKPFAIAETGYTAENVVIKGMGVDFPGSEEQQASYARFILEELHKLNGKFVVWFFGRDYVTDIDFAKLWQYSGMIDRNGKSREALRIWDEWLKLPYKGDLKH